MPDLLLLAQRPDFLQNSLEQSFTCHDYAGAPDREAFLASCASSIRGVVGAGGTVYDEAILSRLPNVEIISVFGVGYDGVPLAYCKQRGIRVTNTPDVLTEDVADTALALVLMTARRLVEANRFLHAGQWRRGQFALASKASGKRAGVVGLGRIGKAIAQRLEAMGMEIGYHGRSAQKGLDYSYFASLQAMAEWCDFLIIACPGGATTKNLINAQILTALGGNGTLINIARGSIVDETALIDALQSGTIKAAGLDVFADEPNVPEALLKLDNAVLLPHVGSGTQETRRDMADLVVRNLLAHFSGQPLLTLIPELCE